MLMKITKYVIFLVSIICVNSSLNMYLVEQQLYNITHFESSPHGHPHRNNLSESVRKWDIRSQWNIFCWTQINFLIIARGLSTREACVQNTLYGGKGLLWTFLADFTLLWHIGEEICQYCQCTTFHFIWENFTNIVASLA